MLLVAAELFLRLVDAEEEEEEEEEGGGLRVVLLLLLEEAGIFVVNCSGARGAVDLDLALGFRLEKLSCSSPSSSG